MNEKPEGFWYMPKYAKRAHFFKGRTSLCVDWSYCGNMDKERIPEWATKKKCIKCQRILDKA